MEIPTFLLEHGQHGPDASRTAPQSLLTLPTDSAARKEVPLFRGLLKYAPAALAGIARISKIGNDKHNPGEELHHARGKSADHADCVLRHLMDVADLEAVLERVVDAREIASDTLTSALLDEVDQMAWRAVMFSQEMHEKYGGSPLAPGAR